MSFLCDLHQSVQANAGKGSKTGLEKIHSTTVQPVIQ